MTGLRVYTGPGESRDLLELLPAPVWVREVASLQELETERSPAILLLSRSLLAEVSPTEWAAIPPHVAVVATDADAEGAAARAGRLHRSVAEARCDGPRLASVLESALQASIRLLEEHPPRR